MAEILKNCPFCGGEANYHEFRKNYITCFGECGAEVTGNDKTEMIRMWNSRPAENELSKKIIRLQNQVEELKDMVHELDPDRVLEWDRFSKVEP